MYLARAPGKTTFAANSRTEIEDFVRALHGLPLEERRRAILMLYEMQTMRPDPSSSAIIGTVRFFGGERGERWLFDWLLKSPHRVERIWRETLEHILDGEDREDEDSVGGWSQREIDLFVHAFEGR